MGNIFNYTEIEAEAEAERQCDEYYDYAYGLPVEAEAEYEDCDKCESRNIRYSMALKEDCCWDCGSTSFTLRP